jgi:transcriptional regulator with XRE-family HTH domain
LNKLRALRKERNITIAQLARYTEVTESYIAMVERGERSPSKCVEEKIAELLDLPVEVIFSKNDSATCSIC